MEANNFINIDGNLCNKENKVVLFYKGCFITGIYNIIMKILTRTLKSNSNNGIYYIMNFINPAHCRG